MNNNVLALLIVAAAIIGAYSRNRKVLVGMLGVIGAIMLFVSATAAQASNFGPLAGLVCFVGSIAVILAFRKRG